MSSPFTCQALVDLWAKVRGTGIRLRVGWRWFLLETPLPWHMTQYIVACQACPALVKASIVISI